MKLDIYQIKVILSFYYNSDKISSSIYNSINKNYDELNYELNNLIKTNKLNKNKCLEILGLK